MVWYGMVWYGDETNVMKCAMRDGDMMIACLLWCCDDSLCV